MPFCIILVFVTLRDAFVGFKCSEFADGLVITFVLVCCYVLYWFVV